MLSFRQKVVYHQNSFCVKDMFINIAGLYNNRLLDNRSTVRPVPPTRSSDKAAKSVRNVSIRDTAVDLSAANYVPLLIKLGNSVI